MGKKYEQVVEPDDRKGLDDFVEIYEKASAGENVKPVYRKSYENEQLMKDANEESDEV